MNFRRYVLHIVLSLVAVTSFAQTKSETTVKGYIKERQSNEALFNVVVSVQHKNIWAVSNDKGYFVLTNVPLGKQEITFSRIGLAEKTIEIDLLENTEKSIEVIMDYKSLGLDEVIVTAKENQNKLSSSSIIKSEAIEHIQANSLGDVLQLLPGQVLTNPDLNNINIASLRLVANNPNNVHVNSFGTSFIMDGAPVSNNANLQVANTAQYGIYSHFETNSGSGVDLRQFSVDNIESVEFVQGVPSAKYGDLTSGAIIINSMAGETPFDVKIRLNPKTHQYFIGKGVNLGTKAGFLNADINYSKSKADIRRNYPNYDRYAMNLLYSNRLFDNYWLTTTKLSVFYSEDNDVEDVEADVQERRYSDDIGIRFTSKGTILYKKRNRGNFKYNLTIDYKNQESYTKRLHSGSVTAISTSLSDGVFEVPFVPSEYYSETKVLGQPLNIFASAENNLYFNKGNLKNNLVFGANWRTDVNFGEGRVITFNPDENIYPVSSYRPRPYKEIPALNQFAVYIEDEMQTKVLNRLLRIQLGLRFDNIQPLNPIQGRFGTTLLPRINISYSISKGIMLRAAYGLASKAPSLVFLYPDKAYFDAQTYQYYHQDYPELSKAFVTTKVFEIDNHQIKSSMNEKAELGIDVNYKKNFLRVLAYSENLKGGHAFLDQFASFDYEMYKLLYFNGSAGIHLIDTINILSGTARNAYKVPVNTRNINTKGVDLILRTTKIKSTGTSIDFNISYTKSISSDESTGIVLTSQYLYENTRRLIGVYRIDGSENERLISNLRLIQHIPEFKMVASMSFQTIWIDKYKRNIRSETPIGYYDIDGNYFAYVKKESLESEDLSFMVREFKEEYYEELSRPKVFLFSFKLTKEMRNNMSLGFYVNNAFMSNPVYYNKHYNSTHVLNPELFFGAELTIKIK